MMNKQTLQEFEAMRRHFGWDESDTLEFLVSCVKEEAEELVHSLNENEEALKKELADVMMYCYAICIDNNYDMDILIQEKIKEVMKREY